MPQGGIEARLTLLATRVERFDVIEGELAFDILALSLRHRP
jgi:hypothetical protein